MNVRLKTLSVVSIIVIALSVIGAANAKSEQSINKFQIKQLIYKRFGTGWVGREMVCIANRESHLNPKAVNWSDSHPTSEGTFRGSFGLFQIGALHSQHSRGAARGITKGNPYRLLDPKVNIEAAWRLYQSGLRSGSNPLGPWGGGC